MCSLNLWKALRCNQSIEVRCVLVYKLTDGIADYDGCQVLCGSRSNLLEKALYIFRQINNLKKIKEEFKPDVTLSTLFNCSTISLLAGGDDKKIGIFHSPHQQVKAKGHLRYLLTLAEYRFLYPRLDYYSCVSEEVRRSIFDVYKNIPSIKVGVVYNVHLIDDILKKSKDILDTPEDERIFSNKIILYCGRLDTNKAPDRLMRAYIASKVYSQYHLVFMGKDEGLGKQVTELAKQHHIEERVHLIGLRHNPYKYIAKSEILASTSYSEGLPGVIIEALALGVPVITTNSTIGVWEIFGCSNEYDKHLKDIKVLADGMITPNTGDDMYDDEMLAKALRDYRREDYAVPFCFRNKVSAENIAKQYLDLI